MNRDVPDSHRRNAGWKRLRWRYRSLVTAGALVAALIAVAVGLDLSAGSSSENGPFSHENFARALAASQLLDGFSGHGAQRNAELLEQYRRQLDPYFADYDTSAIPEVDNSGYTLALQIRDDYINDPEIGILARSEKKGVQWERPGMAVLYRGGRSVFASPVGVRVHGGFARLSEDKYQISWRLYFRSAYRSVDIPASDIWPQANGRLSRLVVLKSDMDLHTAISFDVARRLDLPAPYMVPMRFLMNGEDQRTKLISQHLGMPFLEARFGKERYDYFRRKDDEANPFYKEFHGIVDQLTSSNPDYSLDDVAQFIDTEALMNLYLMQMFIELYDSYQGMIVRRRTGPDRRWFFVPWDLEGSLLYNSLQEEFYGYHPEETREYYVHLGSTRYLTRERIWRDLWWSGEFRRRFARLAIDALNHRLTPGWLNGEVDHYQKIGPGVGLRPRHVDEIEEIRGYLLSRPDAIRAFLSQRWELGSIHRVEIRSAVSDSLRIDGYLNGNVYYGYYLDGMEVVVEEHGRSRAGYWMINGKRLPISDGRFSVAVTEPLLVEHVPE